MSEFKVGDWVVRKPKFQESWWKLKCQQNYSTPPNEPLQVVSAAYGGLNFGFDVGGWDTHKFTRVIAPDRHVNLDDYL